MASVMRNILPLFVVLLAVGVRGFWIDFNQEERHNPEPEPEGRLADTDRGDGGYSCFPWVFNPGCPLNQIVDWDWVCRTNTLGWEQCDVIAENEEEEKEEIKEQESTNEEEEEEEEFVVPMLVPEEEVESAVVTAQLEDIVQDDADLPKTTKENEEHTEIEEPASAPVENEEIKEIKVEEPVETVAVMGDLEDGDEEIVDFDDDDDEQDVEDAREFRAIEDAFERLITSLEGKKEGEKEGGVAAMKENE